MMFQIHSRFWVLSVVIGFLLIQPILCLQSSGTAVQEEPSVAQPSLVPPSEPAKTDTGDTAWLLVSCALVLLMTPGLALFYGGMVRRKNVLGTMMHSMVALAVIGIQWFLFGYCLAFGDSQGGIIGWSSKLLGLSGVLSNEVFPGTQIPIFVHC